MQADMAESDPARASSALAAPWPAPAEAVRPEWIDANGHMNVAYYVLVFDHATDAFLDLLDVGERYRTMEGKAFFVTEAHVTYERELREGDQLQVFTQVLGFDGTRLVLFHQMRCERLGGPAAATNEVLCLNVDLDTRRAVPLAAAARERLHATAAAHAQLPRPARAGRAISLATRRPG